MPERNIHSETVKAWRESWAGALSPQELVDAYEQALDALWRRAHLSLGEVTLMAIVERVLHDGAERFAHLAVLRAQEGGVYFGELRSSAPALDVRLLDESLGGLLVELLRVLGTLTGEILTPGLHQELRKVRVGPAEGKEGKA